MKRNIDTEIQFSGLKSGHYTYMYSLDKSFFETFENEDLRDGNVEFEVELEKRERMMLFTFTFNGQIKTECDRCLGEMTVEVEGKETLCVKFSDTETSDREDEVILPTSAYKIDLAQWMYEYVAVAMPIQHVHADDEEGNSTCDPAMLAYISEGSEENESTQTDEVDPRWAKLLELK